ncbi:hypothetical protein, partial [Niallia sp.]|uniref:hypothetical protein n=1 Tax=Niallia sp. TaxID=2837523 RepID=UPI0028984354
RCEQGEKGAITSNPYLSVLTSALNYMKKSLKPVKIPSSFLYPICNVICLIIYVTKSYVI